MKKIIKGRVYDTGAATMIGYWESGTDPTDFAYCEETLYRKRTGEYFLHGEGRANSRYAVPTGIGDSWKGGEKILPLTYEEAKTWAQAHLPEEDYSSEFDPVPTDGEITNLHISLSADAADRIRKAAAAAGVSVSAYIVDRCK